jgi:preprotein translocase subunit Sec61beta
MDDEQIKQLFLSLMNADTEDAVIAILKEVGYWENPAAWRFYGDSENNFSTIGNQQSSPDAALIEKLVNSVDARLMNECLVRDIDPEGSSAPQTIREAVARFFDSEGDPNSARAGLIKFWENAKRTAIARDITLVATGATATEGNPCFTISDWGEGQTPEMMPDTLLSLHQKNKLRIPFVQGKFNMGGTGVLKFCGHHNLQLMVSRRNPAILKGNPLHPSDMHWSFTVVRREDPEGGRRSSVYTYLAPIEIDLSPCIGKLLHFPADELQVFPEKSNPYGRASKWGTLIKLYEYAVGTGFKAQIPRKGSIKDRVDLLLPEVALPIRIHECRKQFWRQPGAQPRSFETTITGLGVRLDDDKGKNLEAGFPSSCPMSAGGEQMVANIYAFKKGTAGNYRKDEGIIFIINGQTHGHISKDFFRRNKVGLSYLSDCILVTIDCSKVSGRTREDLFMNSRDRLSSGDLRKEIERALEDLLKHHLGLKALKERRRREEIESTLGEDKPLEDILKSLIKQSPALSNLFLLGKRASNPFKSTKVEGESKFFGKRYPTYFKFRGKDYGVVLKRDCHINMHCRISFETDADNDYFSRDVDKGEFSLYIVTGSLQLRSPVGNYTMNLQNGLANLNVRLPENCKVGDELRFIATVTDPTQIEPFENSCIVHVKQAIQPTGGKGGKAKPPGEKEGTEREIPSGITLPNIIEVLEPEWETKDPPFTKTTALRIKNAGPAEINGDVGKEGNVYDFFVNMDNVYLKTEVKPDKKDIRITKMRFKYGLVLLGLAVLQQEMQKAKPPAMDDIKEENNDNDNGENVEDKVEKFSSAVAPVLLPMIESLGDIEIDEDSWETSEEAS